MASPPLAVSHYFRQNRMSSSTLRQLWLLPQGRAHSPHNQRIEELADILMRDTVWRGLYVCQVWRTLYRMIIYSSTQPGHPSVNRRNEYQRRLWHKQAHRTMHYPVSVVSQCTLLSGWGLMKVKWRTVLWTLPVCPTGRIYNGGQVAPVSDLWDLKGPRERQARIQERAEYDMYV